MSSQIGVAQEILDAIELRLIGADHRPRLFAPAFRDLDGRPYIVKNNKGAVRAAQRANSAWTKGSTSDKPDGTDVHGVIRDLALFGLCSQTSNDMGEFVAHAPEDIEILLNEVKSSRARLRRIEDEREEFRKEMLSLRVEKASLQEKLTAMRRTVRDFAALMKETTS